MFDINLKKKLKRKELIYLPLVCLWLTAVVFPLKTSRLRHPTCNGGAQSAGATGDETETFLEETAGDQTSGGGVQKCPKYPGFQKKTVRQKGKMDQNLWFWEGSDYSCLLYCQLFVYYIDTFQTTSNTFQA